VLGYVPVRTPPDGLYVSVGLSVEQSYAAVNRAARIGALLSVIAALGTLVVTWLAGSRIFVLPLQNLKTTIERWRAGERSVRTGRNADEGEIGALGAALDRLMDEIATNQEQRELLSNELAHRVKNTLTIVQAIAVLTMNRRIPAQEALPDFLSRITALGRTNDVLTRGSWDRTDLRDLIIRVAEPLSANTETAFRFDGPTVDLPPQEALGMTMVLHELCTNALKYGSLSRPGGVVLVDWAWRDPEANTLDITWRELGGPKVAAPQRGSGFGTRLIARALGDHGSTKIEFCEDGLLCRIHLTIAPHRETAPA
jgi:two-component sensor histidine kinase